jgi:lysophospholipase L1-like esterase
MTTVFSFGASTAAGSKDDAGGGFIARLGRFLSDTGRGAGLNCGIGGDTTEMMAARLEKVIASLPRGAPLVPVVTLGINDVPRIADDQPQRRVALDRHRALVSDMLARLGQIGNLVYMTQYPVDYAARSLEPVAVKSYVDAGREVAQGHGAHVIDIFAMIDAARFRDFIYEDGLHFNSRGHEFIANILLDELLNLGLV